MVKYPPPPPPPKQLTHQKVIHLVYNCRFLGSYNIFHGLKNEMLAFYMPDAAGLKKLTTDVLHKKILNLEFWGSVFLFFGAL